MFTDTSAVCPATFDAVPSIMDNPVVDGRIRSPMSCATLLSMMDTSAPVSIGGGYDGGDDAANVTAGGGRVLLQTWGGNPKKATTVGVLPELEAQPAMAMTLYNADGTATVVPTSVADGSAVIVRGAGGVAESGPVMAMGQGVAITVPKELTSPYVNEAGPAGSMGISGLQDECIDVADTFLTGNGNVEGRLISGMQPSGRVCSTTTFTYTMRYGSYADCAPRKSVNSATFQAVDTQARSSSQAEVAISVDGCMNPNLLKIAPARTSASTNGGYTWTVTKSADQETLAIGQDATGIVTYTVDFKRTGGKGGATLAADVVVANPSAYPVPTASVTYTATTLCDGDAETTSGPVACDATTVPASGKVACRVTAALPCAGTGAYTVVLTAANGFVVTSPPTPFAFNETQLKSATSGDCADVKDAFLSGPSRIGGALVSGTRPNGKLCGSKTFTYSIKYGPYSECNNLEVSRGSGWAICLAWHSQHQGGCQLPAQQRRARLAWHLPCLNAPLAAPRPPLKLLMPSPLPPHPPLQAANSVTLTSEGLTKSASASHTLPVYVVGCDLYKPDAVATSDCVKPAHWWSKCDAADSKCATGWKLLPGGKGKGTLFFPKPNERSTRTYATMLGGPGALVSLESAAAAKKAYMAAAQAFVTAQLNFLSGARLPNLELQETFDALGSFLATSSEGSHMADDQVAAINLQTLLLCKYNNGTLPADFKSPPLC